MGPVASNSLIMTSRFDLTLVRHGETMENRENVIQGQSDTILSDLGKQQAGLVGTRLQHECFTHMYSSDLSRAASTAQAIVDANQQSSTCRLVLDKRLRERSFGIMEGKKFSDLQEMMRKENISFKSYTPDKGETIEEVTKRAVSFFHSICNLVMETALHPSSSQSSRHQHIHHSGQSELEVREMAAQQSSPIDHDQDDHAVQSTTTSHLSESTSDSTVVDVNEKQDLNILIVSHGLLLKELKRLILDRYSGKLNDDAAYLAQRISPNTGVSKFVMSASKEAGKVRIKCVECCVLDCKAHLSSTLNNDLVTEAKYQDAVLNS